MLLGRRAHSSLLWKAGEYWRPVELFSREQTWGRKYLWKVAYCDFFILWNDRRLSILPVYNSLWKKVQSYFTHFGFHLPCISYLHVGNFNTFFPGEWPFFLLISWLDLWSLMCWKKYPIRKKATLATFKVSQGRINKFQN